jgi:hypothetical protein
MNLTPDYVAWAGIGAMASALVSIVAAVAAFRAADAAKRLTELTVRQQREALVRDVYRDANRSAVLAKRVDQFAETVKIATSNMLVAAQQSAGSAMDKLNHDHQELLARTKEIADYALKLLDSEPHSHSDSALASTQRRLDGHLVQLDAMKERLTTDLELVRSGASDPHALVLRAAQLRNMHRGYTPPDM